MMRVNETRRQLVHGVLWNRITGVAVSAVIAASVWPACAAAHHSFAAESEWRLITHELLIHGRRVDEGVPLDTSYRTVGGRIIPYKRFTPSTFGPSRLVVGASAAMACTDHALIQLLETAGCPGIPVIRSTVPVRP